MQAARIKYVLRTDALAGWTPPGAAARVAGDGVAPCTASATTGGVRPDPVSRLVRLRSVRTSDALWHRISRSFSSSLLMMCSNSAGNAGLSCTGEVAVIFDGILHRAPTSPVQLNPALPAELEHIINKLLEKDREMRCQSASEVRTDLKRTKRDTGSGRTPPVVAEAVQGATPSPATLAAAPGGVQPASASVRKTYLILAACVALLIGAIAAYRYWHRPKAPSGPAKISQISHWNKPMNFATLSPDSHTVAFSSLVGGVEQVFVMLTSGGEPLQLTHDEGDKQVDSFSSDGTEIYYGRVIGRDEEWAVPTLGGTPRRVVSGRSLVPSRDGNSLFYLKSHSDAIFRATKSGLNEQKVYSFDSPPMTPLSVLPFPHGNDLLVESVAGSNYDQMHFHKVNLSDHTALDLGTLRGYEGGAAWAEPGKTLLLSRTVNGLTNLWK